MFYSFYPLDSVYFIILIFYNQTIIYTTLVEITSQHLAAHNYYIDTYLTCV